MGGAPSPPLRSGHPTTAQRKTVTADPAGPELLDGLPARGAAAARSLLSETLALWCCLPIVLRGHLRCSVETEGVRIRHPGALRCRIAA